MGKRAWRMVPLIAFGVAMLKCAYWAAFRPEDVLIAPRERPFQNALVMAQVAVFALAILFNRRANARQLFGTASLVSAASIMSASAMLYLFFPSLGMFAILYGMAFAVLLLGWGTVACSVAPRISALGVTMGFALYSVIVSAIGMGASEFPKMVAAVISVLAPLASGALLLFLMRKGVGTSDERVFKPWGGTIVEQMKSVPRQPIVALFLCVVATSLADTFSGGWMRLVDSGGVLLILPLVYLMLLALLLVWFLALKNDSPLNLWPILILMAFVGLVVFSSLNGYGVDLASGFVTAIAYCTRIFLWYFVCTIVFSKGLSAIPFFGVIYAFASFGPLPVNAALEPLLAQMTEDAVSMLGTVSVALTAVALVAAAFVLFMGKARHAETAPDSPADEDVAPLEGDRPSIDALAGRFGLSSREAEVLQLVLKGYTWPMVADELFISLNTAQSHQRNIYRKLGVHKKRELIELCG